MGVNLIGNISLFAIELAEHNLMSGASKMVSVRSVDFGAAGFSAFLFDVIEGTTAASDFDYLDQSAIFQFRAHRTCRL